MGQSLFTGGGGANQCIKSTISNKRVVSLVFSFNLAKMYRQQGAAQGV